MATCLAVYLLISGHPGEEASLTSQRFPEKGYTRSLNLSNPTSSVHQWIARPSEIPEPSELRALNNHEVEVLISAYRQIDTPDRKPGLIRALGFSENPKATDFLINSAPYEFKERKLEGPAQRAYTIILNALGVAAKKDREAARFLQEYSNFRAWIAAPGFNGLYRVLGLFFRGHLAEFNRSFWKPGINALGD